MRKLLIICFTFFVLFLIGCSSNSQSSTPSKLTQFDVPGDIYGNFCKNLGECNPSGIEIEAEGSVYTMEIIKKSEDKCGVRLGLNTFSASQLDGKNAICNLPINLFDTLSSAKGEECMNRVNSLITYLILFDMTESESLCTGDLKESIRNVSISGDIVDGQI